MVLSGYRMDKPVGYECPDHLYEIMCGCWTLDPIRRPTFEHLQSHLIHFDIASERPYAVSTVAVS